MQMKSIPLHTYKLKNMYKNDLKMVIIKKTQNKIIDIIEEEDLNDRSYILAEKKKKRFVYFRPQRYHLITKIKVMNQ